MLYADTFHEIMEEEGLCDRVAKQLSCTKYSCSLGGDTFTVAITREYVPVIGFKNDETLKAVES